MVPSAANTAAEQSARSLMFGEYDARRRATPISSATPARACRTTSSCTGVRSAIEGHHQVVLVIDVCPVVGQQERRGVLLLDECGTVDHVAGGEGRAMDHPRRRMAAA